MRESATLDAAQPCARCGYDLRGLPEEGRCPECAAPVAVARPGGLWPHADPKWLKSVERGLRRIVRAWAWVPIAPAIALGAVIFSGASGRGAMVATVFGTAAGVWLIASAALLLSGVYVVCEPHRGTAVRRREKSRRVVRLGCLVIGVALGAAGLGMIADSATAVRLAQVLLGPFGLTGMIVVAAFVRYVNWLGDVFGLSLHEQNRRWAIACFVAWCFMAAMVAPAGASGASGACVGVLALLFMLLSALFIFVGSASQLLSTITRALPAAESAWNDAEQRAHRET